MWIRLGKSSLAIDRNLHQISKVNQIVCFFGQGIAKVRMFPSLNWNHFCITYTPNGMIYVFTSFIHLQGGKYSIQKFGVFMG